MGSGAARCNSKLNWSWCSMYLDLCHWEYILFRFNGGELRCTARSSGLACAIFGTCKAGSRRFGGSTGEVTMNVDVVGQARRLGLHAHARECPRFFSAEFWRSGGSNAHLPRRGTLTRKMKSGRRTIFSALFAHVRIRGRAPSNLARPPSRRINSSPPTTLTTLGST